MCVDLGCGHGVATQAIASSFTKVIGTDPSAGMLDQARSISTSKPGVPNIEYRESSAEDLPFLENESVDMVIAAQAAHWFDYPKLFPEMERILRKGATLAFWGYRDHVFVDHENATDILFGYSYGRGANHLGNYWQQPGRDIVQNRLRDIRPPTESWEDIQRIEYRPRPEGRNSGQGTLFLEKKMKLGDCMNYIRTWSAYHGWLEKHPKRQKREAGGPGDAVDAMFDDMRKEEPEWQGKEWINKEVNIEWGSGLLLARRK